MSSTLKTIICLAICLFVWTGLAAAQSLSSPAERMAATIGARCIAALHTGEVLEPEDFGDQFVVDRVQNGTTRLRQARGQPWVRLSLNDIRSGTCTVSFSSAGRNSFAAAEHLADLINQHPDLMRVTVPPWRAAFTVERLGRPFDKERDPYIGYTPAAGYQTMLFLPAAPLEPSSTN